MELRRTIEALKTSRINGTSKVQLKFDAGQREVYKTVTVFLNQTAQQKENCNTFHQKVNS